MKKDIEVIAKELTFDHIFLEVSPDYVNLQGIASPYKLFRYDGGADRYYFVQMSEGGELAPVISVTSLSQKVLNNAAILMKWQDNVGGGEMANYIKNMRAEYGTLVHIIFAEILKTGQFDFDEYRMRAWKTAIDLGYKFEADTWSIDIIDDVVAFMTFLIEKEVEVIGIEFPIADVGLGIGCTLDLICRLKFGTKKVNAIVDFKSGRKGFFEGHEYQLGIQRLIWNLNFKSIFDVTHVFNFAPTASLNKEKYKLKNQTDSVLVQNAEIEALLVRSRGLLDGVKMEHKYITGAGFLASFKLEEHVKTVSKV